MSSLKRKAGSSQPGSSSDAKKPKQNGNIMSFFGAPKPGGPLNSSPTTTSTTTRSTTRSQSQLSNSNSSASASATPDPATVTSKFNKEKWVASLTPEQRDLLQLEIDTLDESWLAHLKEEIVTKEFLDLKRFLKKEWETKTIFPPKEDIYSWSRHTPLPTVRIVILGQDPYHNHSQAHGLSFSVRPPTPAPPSLRNIFIGLSRDYPTTFTPPPAKGGLLTPWADRGVLLLNTVLTVRAHEANSHAGKGWERFTQRVIDLVNERQRGGVVFMAWGAPAGKRVSKVNEKRHLVLRSVHPSPLSAHRGFFEAGHFRRGNEWLEEKYGKGGRVDWSLVEGRSVFDDEVEGEGGKEEGEKKKVGGEEEEDEDEFEGGEIFDEEGLKEVEAVVEKVETEDSAPKTPKKTKPKRKTKKEKNEERISTFTDQERFLVNHFVLPEKRKADPLVTMSSFAGNRPITTMEHRYAPTLGQRVQWLLPLPTEVDMVRIQSVLDEARPETKEMLRKHKLARVEEKTDLVVKKKGDGEEGDEHDAPEEQTDKMEE